MGIPNGSHWKIPMNWHTPLITDNKHNHVWFHALWGEIISAGYSRNEPKGDQQIPQTRCIEECAEKQTVLQIIEQENRFHQYES